MRSSSSTFAIAVILVIAFVTLSEAAQPTLKSQHGLNASEVKCTYVVRHTKTCLDWTKQTHKNPSEKPPKTCCYEINKLDTMGADSRAKAAICECLKKQLQDPKVNTKAAESLTSGCSVVLPFPLSPKVDCSKLFTPNTKQATKTNHGSSAKPAPKTKH